MSLTKEDLQAIGELIDGKLEPMRADIIELKESVRFLQEALVRIELVQYPRITAALEGSAMVNGI